MKNAGRIIGYVVLPALFVLFWVFVIFSIVSSLPYGNFLTDSTAVTSFLNNILNDSSKADNIAGDLPIREIDLFEEMLNEDLGASSDNSLAQNSSDDFFSDNNITNSNNNQTDGDLSSGDPNDEYGADSGGSSMSGNSSAGSGSSSSSGNSGTDLGGSSSSGNSGTDSGGSSSSGNSGTGSGSSSSSGNSGTGSGSSSSSGNSGAGSGGSSSSGNSGTGSGGNSTSGNSGTGSGNSSSSGNSSANNASNSSQGGSSSNSQSSKNYSSGRLNASSIKYPSIGVAYGRVKIDEVGVNAKLYFGDNSDILRRGIGHFTGSGFPGEPSTILLSGHNNSYFKPLQNVKPGMRVSIETNYGNFLYEIVNTKVCSERDSSAYDLNATKENLIMYTCYPFVGIGLKSERLFVYAKKVAGPTISVYS